jgi:hypothetical protein
LYRLLLLKISEVANGDNVSCGFPIMLAHYRFEVPEFFLVIPVIDTISVKKKDVSGTHERDLSDIG